VAISLGATKCGVKKGAQCTILASQTPIFIARVSTLTRDIDI